jgi:hypothetical protein
VKPNIIDKIFHRRARCFPETRDVANVGFRAKATNDRVIQLEAVIRASGGGDREVALSIARDIVSERDREMDAVLRRTDDYVVRELAFELALFDSAVYGLLVRLTEEKTQ